MILEDFYKNRTNGIRIYKKNAPTLRSERIGLLVLESSDRGQSMAKNIGKYRIRKLTPRECFRLQGMTAEDCDKASAVSVSNSQLYKQIGNGICTNCVELLFEHLYKAQYDPEFETYDENFARAVMA